MGMDVYGTKPTTKVGEYFRNNVWWWRPLAAYCCEVAPTITAHCQYWQSNDGDGLTAAQSRRLADVLDRELASGRTQAYADRYTAAQACMPKEPCRYCEATGTRRDAVGHQMGMPTKRIPPEDPSHPRAGELGWCNGCNGTGSVEPWACHYPFSVENVQEFVAFLRACGGFKIC